VSGLDDPTAGRVEVRGKPMMGVPAHRRPVTTVFQNYALFPHLDIFENVAFGLRERRVANDEVRRRVAGMLELVDLVGREKAKPRELSGGQQQRVALARSLVLDPEVLLLDEPLGALDLRLRKQLQGLLKTVQREVGITFVYVTHDQEEAFSMSDRVAILRAGEIEQVGPPREVYQEPRTAFVADFVGGANRIPVAVVGAPGAGRYRVEAPGVATWEAAGVPGLAVGDAAIAIVRPEAMRLGEGEVVLGGVVRDVSFVGPFVNLEVVVAGDGPSLRCMAPGRTPQAEAATRFAFDADDAWIVAADGGVEAAE
jgi:spermidine/putrescine transport system ATP-binding protein